MYIFSPPFIDFCRLGSFINTYLPPEVRPLRKWAIHKDYPLLLYSFLVFCQIMQYFINKKLQQKKSVGGRINSRYHLGLRHFAASLNGGNQKQFILAALSCNGLTRILLLPHFLRELLKTDPLKSALSHKITRKCISPPYAAFFHQPKALCGLISVTSFPHRFVY